MSYDVELTEPVLEGKETVYKRIVFPFKHDMKGGTYALGGTNEAWLNITYNYAPIFKKIFGEEGIRTIYGKSGEETIPLFEKGILYLGDEDIDVDYWKATNGNVKAVLEQLLALARLRPDGVWNGD